MSKYIVTDILSKIEINTCIVSQHRRTWYPIIRLSPMAFRYPISVNITSAGIKFNLPSSLFKPREYSGMFVKEIARLFRHVVSAILFIRVSRNTRNSIRTYRWKNFCTLPIIHPYTFPSISFPISRSKHVVDNFRVYTVSNTPYGWTIEYQTKIAWKRSKRTNVFHRTNTNKFDSRIEQRVLLNSTLFVASTSPF